MTLHQETLTLVTRKPIEVVAITEPVTSLVTKRGWKNGLVHLASGHTTMGLVMNERCERLQEDMVDFLKRLVPPDAVYRHNSVTVDGRPNAHSHLASLLIPSQLTLVVKEGSLGLGPWQTLFAVELDGPRPDRKITLSFIPHA